LIQFKACLKLNFQGWLFT